MAIAILIMVVAMSFIPLGDAAGKMLVERHGVSPVFVAWARFAIGAAVLVPCLPRRTETRTVLLDWRVLLRGGLIVAAICCILTALRTEPLANVYGAFFVGPILSYALSAMLLRETVRPAQTVLLIAGFIGVLLVARPVGGVSVGTGFAMLAGAFYGCYLTASRWLSDRPPELLMLAQLIFGTVVLVPVAVLDFPLLSLTMIGLFLLSGLASLAGNLLLLLAYRRMAATRLAPLVYFQLVAATGWGLAFFGDWPGTVVLLGLILIVATGFASLALRQPS